MFKVRGENFIPVPAEILSELSDHGTWTVWAKYQLL